MRRAWQGAGVALLAFGVFALYESFKYPLRDPLGPGPGFFPAWLSALTILLSLALIAQIARAKVAVPESSSLIPEGSAALRSAAVLVGLIAVAILLDYLGFRLTMLLFLVFIPVALGARNWFAILTTAIVGSLGVFHVFYYWLKVPLPIGSFGI